MKQKTLTTITLTLLALTLLTACETDKRAEYCQNKGYIYAYKWENKFENDKDFYCLNKTIFITDNEYQNYIIKQCLSNCQDNTTQ